MRHNPNIDLIKLIAMLGILLAHSVSCIGMEKFGYGSEIFRIFVVCIPLFFMVAGFLSLGREGNSMRYAIKRIVGIIKFCATIGAIGCLWDVIRYGAPFSFVKLAVCCFEPMFGLGRFSIFWFFGALIVVYALYPAVNTLFIHHKHRVQYLVIILLVIQQIVFLGILCYPPYPDINSYPFLDYDVWNWMLCFCIGGIIKTGSLPQWITRKYVLVLFLILIIPFQWLLFPIVNSFNVGYFYSSLPVDILATAIFAGCMRLDLREAAPFMKLVPGIFLPVYFIHLPIIVRLRTSFPDFGVFTPTIFWLACCAVILPVAYIMARTPVVNRIFKI